MQNEKKETKKDTLNTKYLEKASTAGERATMGKRQVKFRAWIPEYLDEDEDGNVPYVMCYDLAFEDYEPINDLLQRVEHLMQFTGVYDQNGEEIYEGDIVKWSMSYGKPFYSVVEWKTEWCSFVCFAKTKSGKCWTRPGDDVEVIGNIYETPELVPRSG